VHRQKETRGGEVYNNNKKRLRIRWTYAANMNVLKFSNNRTEIFALTKYLQTVTANRLCKCISSESVMLWWRSFQDAQQRKWRFITEWNVSRVALSV
jgi:hypothetical protein